MSTVSSPAVDCGHVVNPGIVEAQIQGGIIFGLSAALYGDLTIKNGAIEQNNFDQYEMVRLADAPKIEVYLALSGGKKWAVSASPARRRPRLPSPMRCSRRPASRAHTAAQERKARRPGLIADRAASRPIVRRASYWPPAAGGAFAQQIKGAKLAALDAAHISNVEQPKAFIEAVLNFPT